LSLLRIDIKKINANGKNGIIKKNMFFEIKQFRLSYALPTHI